MLSEQHRKLIQALINATEDRSLKWSKTVLRNKFSATVNRYGVSIYFDDPLDKFISMGSEVIYQLDFIDIDGEVFDSIKVRSKNDETFPQLERLYFNARRSALEIDTKLDNIISGL